MQGYAALHHPGRRGASEVVRGDGVDARPSTRLMKVTADVSPRAEEQSALSFRVAHRMLNERVAHTHDGHRARRALGFGPSYFHLFVAQIDVFHPRPVRLP